MMKKVLAVLIICLLCTNNSFASAKTTTDENGNIILSSDCYTEDGKIKLYPTWYENNPAIINAELPNINWAIPKLTFMGMDGKFVSGYIEYPNYSEISPGSFDLQWAFTPDDSKTYETKNGVFHFYFFPEDSESSKGKISETNVTDDEITIPSLTAASVLLDSSTSYDINLYDSVPGSTYLWTSSDESVVSVDKKTGKIKAKKDGKSTVTCVITFPDKSTKKLVSEVTVGYDDNAPLLTETSLDLEKGDVFDINLENKVAKSKYRWTSSNRSIVKVNTSTGKVMAVTAGDAYVTCTITTPANQVIVLRCDISITDPDK